LVLIVLLFRLRLDDVRQQDETGIASSVLAPDLPGNFLELFKIRQPPVFIVRALHNIERNPNGIPSGVAEYDAFAFCVALDDTRMRTRVAARLCSYRGAAIYFSIAHSDRFSKQPTAAFSSSGNQR